MKEITIDLREQFVLNIKGLLGDEDGKSFLVKLNGVKIVHFSGTTSRDKFITEIELQTNQITK